MSIFLTFEGIEGVGKTTQIQRLATTLRERGQEVLTTREPGGCPLADAIRGILLDPASAALVPRSELLLYAAARAQHVDEVVRPALRSGKTVLCDRFTDATVAYQGYGRGLDLQLIESLNRLASDDLRPDLTILLDLPAAEGLRRARHRNLDQALQQEERFERESIEFHSRIRDGYLQLARREQRFRLIDATGSEEEVARRVAAAVDLFLQQRR